MRGAERATNIAACGVRRRRRTGVVALAVSVVFAVALVVTGAPIIWRLLLFVPLMLAATGFLQAREKT